MNRIVTLAHVGRRHAGWREVANTLDTAIDVIRAVRYGVVIGALVAVIQAVTP